MCSSRFKLRFGQWRVHCCTICTVSYRYRSSTTGQCVLCRCFLYKDCVLWDSIALASRYASYRVVINCFLCIFHWRSRCPFCCHIAINFRTLVFYWTFPAPRLNDTGSRTVQHVRYRTYGTVPDGTVLCRLNTIRRVRHARTNIVCLRLLRRLIFSQGNKHEYHTAMGCRSVK